MGSSNIVEQHSAFLAPEDGQILAITLDATSRSYSLGPLDFGGVTPGLHSNRRSEVFVTIQSLGADAHLSFSPASVTVNEATTVAAGGTAAFASGMAFTLLSNAAPMRFRLDRSRHKFLNVKGSAAGTLRIHVSSHATT